MNICKNSPNFSKQKFPTQISESRQTYSKLQGQFKLLVLEKLLDLSGHGDRNESPNKMIAGHVDNV